MKLLGSSSPKIGPNDIWHTGNLTKISQLQNDNNFVTATNHSHGILDALGNNYRQGSDLPSRYPRGISIFFSNQPDNKFNNTNYCTIVTFKGYTNMAVTQYIYPYNVDAPIYYRHGLYNDDSWTEWRALATIKDIPTKLSDLTNDIGVGGGSATIIKKDIILRNNLWVYDDVLDYWKLDYSDADITENSIVDINVQLLYLDSARDIVPSNQSYNGKVAIYARSVPLDDIVCDIKITK